MDEAPQYLVHDRDTAFQAWATTASALGIDEVITAVRGMAEYAERLIGSIRLLSRPVASPGNGEVMAIPQLDGLHHRYERRAA